MDQIVEKLATIPLLANLTDDQRQSVTRACECIFIAPGKTIVAQGETADAAYLCLDDTIIREYVTEPGAEPQIDSVPANSVVLELAMIVEAEATARFVAEGHARVLKVSRQKLLSLLEEDPAMARVMSETLSQRLADVAHTMREAVACFAAPGAGGRDQAAAEAKAEPAPVQASSEAKEEERRSA